MTNFGDVAAISCEHAVLELRSGRPVLIQRANELTRAYLALDTCTSATLETFAAATHNTHSLYLSKTRAQVLGLTAPLGIRIPLGDSGWDYAELLKCAYLRHASPPRQWQEGDQLDQAAVDLARAGLLLPALIGAPIRPSDENAFDGCQRISEETVATHAVEPALSRYQLVVKSPVPLRGLGMCEFAVFRGGIAQRDQVAIIVGKLDLNAPVPVRVHSSCLTGDLFGSLKCDCGDQLRQGLATLHTMGGGVLVYLDQEGRGTGIAAKMRAYGYQHEGLDTIDADAQLGFGPDERRFESAASILKELGIHQIVLLSNNPSKAIKLAALGIQVVSRLPVTGHVTRENEFYLRTKASRAGHDLDVDTLLANRSSDNSKTP